jgi:hypothetical protein
VPKLPDPIARFVGLARSARDEFAKPGEVGKDDPNDLGVSGLEAMGSDREVNPELAGNLRYARLDEMVLSDPVVAGSMLSVKLPQYGTEWRLREVSEDPTDLMVARACRRQFGLAGGEDDRDLYDSWIAGGWDAVLGTMGLHLDYGSMTAETVWGDDLVTWTDVDGQEHTILPIVRLAPRYPHSLTRYRGGPSAGIPLGGVYQDGVKAELPGAKLVHLVHQPHLSRFTGASILRPAYGLWRLKRKMIVSGAIGFDRFAAGTPLVWSPGTGGAEEERLARSIGRDMKNHERAYIWLRGKKAGPDTPGWDVQMLDGAGTLADPIPQLRHYDEQMVSAVLGRFFMLGSTDVGSRAVGEVLSEPFYQALNWHTARTARELTQQLVARFVAVNFGPDVAVPQIVPATIQQKNLPTRGEFLDRAAAAGLDIRDREAQNVIRGWVDLPPLPEGWVHPEDRAAQAAPGEGTSPAILPRAPRVIGPNGQPTADAPDAEVTAAA